MRRFFLLIALVVFFSCLPVALKKFTCGFKLTKIHFAHPFCLEWEVDSDLSHEEVCHILSQPFFYLDRGAQCYVFASLDKKYVIKFFRKNDRQLNSLCKACVLAYTEAKEETGLIFLHLNWTEGLFPPLHIRGPIGQFFTLSLDQYRFAIQKRVSPFRESFLNAYKTSDDEGMRERIDSFVALLRSRAGKGIRNADPTVNRNFGFLGTQAVEIDFGNYAKGTLSKEWEVARYTHRLHSWLIDNAPEWADYLTNSLKDSGLEGQQIQLPSQGQEK